MWALVETWFTRPLKPMVSTTSTSPSQWPMEWPFQLVSMSSGLGWVFSSR